MLNKESDIKHLRAQFCYNNWFSKNALLTSVSAQCSVSREGSYAECSLRGVDSQTRHQHCHNKQPHCPACRPSMHNQSNAWHATDEVFLSARVSSMQHGKRFGERNVHLMSNMHCQHGQKAATIPLQVLHGLRDWTKESPIMYRHQYFRCLHQIKLQLSTTTKTMCLLKPINHVI